jgi:PIN domain nuclease of toxin-antitoxin system
MKLLLDTHALLWFLDDSPALSARAKAAIEHPDTETRVSVASLWEITIKSNLGKLDLSEPFPTLFPAQLDINGFIQLPVHLRHLYELECLPRHHRDPFDRLLIAQARTENLTLVSRDTHFASYHVAVLG